MYNALSSIGKGLYNAVRNAAHFTLKGDLETLVGGLGFDFKLDSRKVFLGLKAGLHTSEDDFVGIKLGWRNNTGYSVTGLETGVENYSNVVLGGQVGGKNYSAIALGGQGGLESHADSLIGVQVGVVNTAGSAYGGQIGVINGADDLVGFQVGGICRAGDGNYLQFGALTIRNEGPWYSRVTPFIGGHTNIKPFKNAQGFLRRVVLSWIALYIAASAYAAIDYKLVNASRIEQDQTNTLQVRRYKVIVDGREKDLTLVGETHNYTKTEAEAVRKLVDEHNTLAAEFNVERPTQSLGYRVYSRATIIFDKVPDEFEQFGSGRFHNNPHIKIAREKGLKIYALERDLYGPLSFNDRASFLANIIVRLLTAPERYYGERFDFNSGDNVCIRPDDPYFRDPLVTKRNPKIAGRISELIQREEIDDLLATTGGCHLNGVITILEKEWNMQEIAPEPKSDIDRQTRNM